MAARARRHGPDRERDERGSSSTELVAFADVELGRDAVAKLDEASAGGVAAARLVVSRSEQRVREQAA